MLGDLERVGVDCHGNDDRQDPENQLDSPLVPARDALHVIIEPLLGGSPKRDRISLCAVQEGGERLLHGLTWDLVDRLVDLAKRVAQIFVIGDRNGLLLQPEQRRDEGSRWYVRREVGLAVGLQPVPLERRASILGLVFWVKHGLYERMLLEPLKRLDGVLRVVLGVHCVMVPEEFPEAALEVLGPPTGKR